MLKRKYLFNQKHSNLPFHKPTAGFPLHTLTTPKSDADKLALHYRTKLSPPKSHKSPCGASVAMFKKRLRIEGSERAGVRKLVADVGVILES